MSSLMASLDLMISGGEIRILKSSCGVDIQAPVAAPGREALRVDVRFDGDEALSLDLLKRLLGALEPQAEGPR